MPKPTEVRALPDYRIQIRYDDGVEGEVDLSHLVGQGVFAVWSDPSFFGKVHLGTGGAIAWNEEIELCPDSIYLEITGKAPEELLPGLSPKAAHA